MDKSEQRGYYHPLTLIQREVNDIFYDLGFAVAEGPEVETEKYNFDALNIPATHPARDLWDTFWLKENKLGQLLRTHTSPVQVRYMETHEPPFAIIAPGKVFRYEATDATHEAQFYQLEGLMIGENINLGHLKGVLNEFFDRFLGQDMSIRLRPSFFPFVEPGVEVDMRSSESDKWIEVMGAGMVHPKVLQNAGIDHRRWQGFAFGMGMDRLGILKYGIPDVRMYYTGDLRVTNQFKWQEK
jgi:phenylalanyl-tRNA synthetase alpha chain